MTVHDTMMIVAAKMEGRETDMSEHEDSERDLFIMLRIPLLCDLARLCLDYAL
jgi:hypothetical protein